jgi:hypothetical protein
VIKIYRGIRPAIKFYRGTNPAFFLVYTPSYAKNFPKFSHLDENKFWKIFSIRWGINQKNAKKNIYLAMIIHTPFESPYQIWSI